MQNAKEWIVQKALSDKEWLIIGKGPSFGKLRPETLDDYLTVAINHTVKEVEVDACQIIDFSIAVDCAEEIARNADVLIMPLYPHIDHSPSSKNLYELVEEHPILAGLKNTGRLYWYNSSTAGNRFDLSYPIIKVKAFSADAVVALLADAGVSEIRTSGIDGGNAYSNQFDYLNDTMLLANGQKSFNEQFRAILSTTVEYGINVRPVHQKEVIRIYVGAQAEQELAVRVLEYSIRRHTSYKVEVHSMAMGSESQVKPMRAAGNSNALFSYQRFLVPKLCSYKGKAIYLDFDTQVFADINELFSIDMAGKDLLSATLQEGEQRAPEPSVMLLDCEKLQRDFTQIVKKLDAGESTCKELMKDMNQVNWEEKIDSTWNSQEVFEPGKTRLIRYADMNTQPWVSTNNPYEMVWVSELNRAITDGVLTVDFVKSQVKEGNVRPSLFFQVTKGRSNKGGYTLIKKLLDVGFVPPHKSRIRSHSRLKSKVHQVIKNLI